MNTFGRYDLAVDDNTTATNANTDSINRENAARQNVNKALDGFGTVLGSIIKGAPKSIAPILAAAPGLDRFAKMMGFAEGYVDVWRNLTTRGVNFGNQLDTMITAVGAANLQIQDFQRLVENNGSAMIALGGTMNTGAIEFLRLQANFEKLDGPFQGLRTNLNLLGMSTEIIAERFAENDTLDAIRNVKTRRGDAQRNRSANEYALTLDTLSRLTGKQADALAAEMVDISRQGNVYAFGQQIGEQVRDELDIGVTELGQYGAIVKDYAIDMLTRGTPNANDPSVQALHSTAPELRDALYRARDALKEGNEGLAKQYFAQASAAASELRNNQTLIRYAALGSLTDFTSGAQEILTQVNSSTLAMSQQAIQEQAKKMFGSTVAFTSEQMAQARAQIVADDKAAQTAAGGTDGKKLLTAQVLAVQTLQHAAQELQKVAVTNIAGIAEKTLSELSSAMGNKGELLGKYMLDGMKDTIDRAYATVGAISTNADESSRMGRAADQQANMLSAMSATFGIDSPEGKRLYDMANALTDAKKEHAEAQTPDSFMALALAIDNAATTITANKDIFVSGKTINFAGDLSDSIKEIFGGAINAILVKAGFDRIEFARGTMGEAGSLFKDFGTETITALHGLEAVVTPEQMHAIVRNSALGAMEASSTVFGQQTARNNSGVLDGMLNTIRTMPAQMSQMQSNTDSNELKSTMTQLGTELKSSLVSALNSTLVPSVDKLVTISAQNADTSDKIRRGIGNMSNDMLRSV